MPSVRSQDVGDSGASGKQITHYVGDDCPGGHQEGPRLVFTVPLPPRELSPNVSVHWQAKRRAAEAYAEAVWLMAHSVSDGIAGGAWRDYHDTKHAIQSWPWAKAKVTLTQRAVRPKDHDNLLASCKVLIDCLHTKGRRPLGIIEDDAPLHLIVTVETERVKRKVDEGIVVEIEKVE